MTDHASTVRGLTGVYHADGGIRGELAYVAGKLLGRVHCGLCDVTHGPLYRKRQWDSFVAGLGVSFHLVHLNERDPAISDVSQGVTPCVIAHTDTGPILVLDAQQVDAANGDVETFADLLRDALTRHALSLPTGHDK
ncbi:hypothetical protein KBX06_22115 [Micromonospora sp. C31]|uniref:hypothetical protein n=1 Tax=Micromonospora sp. C31 TaxID=2824876 RepID=UPI001B35AEE2|nr:hypothetical protein [Micromonospora sp. C31]MBQ1075833.1 hypothetical protein [Micromonospora sp. C31]